MLVAQRSRHRIHRFSLHRPRTAAEAVAMHAASQGVAAYMSGGIDLIAAMKAGSKIDDVVHLDRLANCAVILKSDDDIVIGAGVTHDELARSELVRCVYPDLCEAWAALANYRVRIKGTVGGNIMARNVSYDFLLAAIASGARIDLIDRQASLRSLPALAAASIEPGALVTAIRLPAQGCQALGLQLDWKPTVAFAIAFCTERGVPVVRLAVGTGYEAAAVSALHLDRDLREIRSSQVSELAARLCVQLPSPLVDWRASAEYRRHIIQVLVRRKIDRMREMRALQ